MVIPTQRYEIVWIVVATEVLFCDVVDLEPVAAPAAFYGALPLVTVEDPGPDSRGDRLGEVRDRDRTVNAVGPYNPDAAFTEDLRQGGRSRP
jgi:hypothetical protein